VWKGRKRLPSKFVRFSTFPLLERIEARGSGFKSLTEAIDTTTPAGRMMMQMVGAFAEFERAMICERTLAGLIEAKGNGRVGGRRKKLKPHQEKEIAVMILQAGRSAAQVARLFNVHPATVGRIVARHKPELLKL
jgi:DNA invertase Pin-like site-specific DNA recombinase